MQTNYLVITFDELDHKIQDSIREDINRRLIDEGVLDDDLPDAVDNEIAKLHWELEY